LSITLVFAMPDAVPNPKDFRRGHPRAKRICLEEVEASRQEMGPKGKKKKKKAQTVKPPQAGWRSIQMGERGVGMG